MAGHISHSHNYRPPTILREGNVFSRVCLPVRERGEGSPCGHYPWWHWSLTIQGPQLYSPCPHHIVTPPRPSTPSPRHGPTPNFGKQAVGIQLKCLLKVTNKSLVNTIMMYAMFVDLDLDLDLNCPCLQFSKLCVDSMNVLVFGLRYSLPCWESVKSFYFMLIFVNI